MANKCSTLLVIREICVETRTVYHYTPTEMAAIKHQTTPSVAKDVDKQETSHILVRMEMGQLSWVTFWQFLKVLNVNYHST